MVCIAMGQRGMNVLAPEERQLSQRCVTLIPSVDGISLGQNSSRFLVVFCLSFFFFFAAINLDFEYGHTHGV